MLGDVKRTTVLLPDDLDRRLRWEAQARGVSIGELVRTAVANELRREASGLPDWVGSLHGSRRRDDAGRTHREIAIEAMVEDHARQRREYAEDVSGRDAPAR